ncbi:unnamed protein product [Caenorhabditis brenneri]
MTSNAEIVKLNIGGTQFQTTESTLTRFDGFFKTILETDVPVTKDETGAFFIDRDPTHFRLILNFMRDGDVELPVCKQEIKEISKEAQYYLLTGLVELCSKQSEVQPNTDIFKILDTQSERDLAVLNSNKPVVIMFHETWSVVDYVAVRGYDKWKQFIEKHSPKWNIFFSKAKENKWYIHHGAKTFSECNPDYYREQFSCGHPYTYDSLEAPYGHLEYHMNRCLTHPEDMDSNSEQYSDFLEQ